VAELMIKCPKTGKYVRVEIQMDAATFASCSFEGNQVPCPHCGETHVWGSKDARLIEQQP
jgi:endogenous inhibitor of DNA gyrase (YacG/DUF329 family)